jgi:hypothetical protein
MTTSRRPPVGEFPAQPASEPPKFISFGFASGSPLLRGGSGYGKSWTGGTIRPLPGSGTEKTRMSTSGVPTRFAAAHVFRTNRKEPRTFGVNVAAGEDEESEKASGVEAGVELPNGTETRSICQDWTPVLSLFWTVTRTPRTPARACPSPTKAP